MLSKLRASRFLSGAGVYLLANIANAAIPFALLPILTRYMSPQEYGQVAMFQTLIIALSAITGLSVHGAANRKFYDEGVTDSHIREYIAACLQILVVSTLLVTLVVLVLGEGLAGWLGLELWHVVAAVALSSATFIGLIRMGQWQVRHQASRFGGFQISRSLLDFLLSLVLVVILLQGAGGRIVGQSVAVVAFALVALLLLHKDNLLAFFVWRPGYIREALRFGVPLIPHIVGGFLLTAADRFVINSRLGLDQAGIYMVAVQISMGLAIVFGAINQAYVPWLYERLKADKEVVKRQIVRITYQYFAALLVLAVLAFVVGPFVTVLIAGEAYQGAGQVIGWLCLGQVFSGMYLMVTNYIFYSKRTGALSMATLFSGCLNLALMLGLVGVLGIEGAAISFAVACGVKFVLTWWLASLRHPMPWFEFRKIFSRNSL